MNLIKKKRHWNICHMMHYGHSLFSQELFWGLYIGDYIFTNLFLPNPESPFLTQIDIFLYIRNFRDIQQCCISWLYKIRYFKPVARQGAMNSSCIMETNNRLHSFFYASSLLVLLQSCMMLTAIKKYVSSHPMNRQEKFSIELRSLWFGL